MIIHISWKKYIIHDIDTFQSFHEVDVHSYIIWQNRLHTMIYEQLLFIIAEWFDVWNDVGLAMMRTKINIWLDVRWKWLLGF